jgi:hypothetical protein
VLDAFIETIGIGNAAEEPEAIKATRRKEKATTTRQAEVISRKTEKKSDLVG